MAYDENRVMAVNESISTTFDKDRGEWNTKIKELVEMIKNMNELAMCQVYMLSYRQQLLDKMAGLKKQIYKSNNSWDRNYRIRYESYFNHNIKLSSNEKDKFVKSDLVQLRRQIDYLNNHLEYYIESIKTLDNMAFAINNRIKLDEEQQ